LIKLRILIKSALDWRHRFCCTSVNPKDMAKMAFSFHQPRIFSNTKKERRQSSDHRPSFIW